MRILVLTSDRSSPPVTGPKVRNHYLWPALRAHGAEVRVLGLAQRPTADPTSDFGEFFPMDRALFPVRIWNTLSHSYHEWPTSSALREHVRQVTAAWRPEIVHAEELRMCAYLPHRPPGGREPLFSVTLHNVESDLLRLTGSSPIRFGRRVIERRHRRSFLTFERDCLARVDVAFAYSPADCARYRQMYPTFNWSVTRNGTDAIHVQPSPQPLAPSVLLVGSLAYVPNVRGLHWFLDSVAPFLVPDIAVTVAGSGAGDDLRARLATARVRFADTPTDLTPFYAEHAVCAVPVLEGSGTRGKILEALAHERAVVSTPLGVQGLDLTDGEGVVSADSPQDFAAQIRRLARDPAARGALASRGRAAVLARYDWSVVAAELLENWTRCASR